MGGPQGGLTPNLNFSDRFVFNIFIDIVAVNIKSIQGE